MGIEAPTTLDPRQAIAQFFQHQLTGTQLLRGLAGYRGWIVPANFNAQAGGEPTFITFNYGENDRHFFMFSDRQAYMDCRARLGIDALGQYTIDNLYGYNAWENVGEDVNVININPYSPSEIHYKQDQIPRLREWASVIRVEQALEQVLATDKGYDTIKAFKGYYFGMVSQGDQKYVALAPDGKGRKLAALFTADDTAQAYQDEQKNAGLQLLTTDGTTLFRTLAKMPLDGIVFNCSGPIKPRAFTLAFAAEVLHRG
jgi:hypothetical protein